MPPFALSSGPTLPAPPRPHPLRRWCPQGGHQPADHPPAHSTAHISDLRPSHQINPKDRLVVFNLIRNNFVTWVADSCPISLQWRKRTQIGEFLCSRFDTEDGGKKQNIFSV